MLQLLKGSRQLFARPSVQFLSSREENFLVALPWVAAFLTIGLWAVAKVGFELPLSDVTMLVTSLIFMDGVHIIFTLILLATLPELRKWTQAPETRAKTGWLRGLGPLGRTAIVGAALGIIFWILKISPSTSSLRGMATTWLFFELLGPAQHTLAQMRGISMCYNSSIRKAFDLSDAEKALAARSEQLERFFFFTLLIGEVMYWVPEIFELDQLAIRGMNTCVEVGGFLAVASAVAIVVNALYFPRQEKSRKFAFIFRVMLFPLKILSPVGGIGVRAAHGTEYLVIFRRMVQGSKETAARKSQIMKITILASLIYGVVFCLTWREAMEVFNVKQSDALFNGILLTAFVLRFTHYYMDSVLYKMSDPATRGAVGPLLTVPLPSEDEVKVAIAAEKEALASPPVKKKASKRVS